MRSAGDGSIEGKRLQRRLAQSVGACSDLCKRSLGCGSSGGVSSRDRNSA